MLSQRAADIDGERLRGSPFRGRLGNLGRRGRIGPIGKRIDMLAFVVSQRRAGARHCKDRGQGPGDRDANSRLGGHGFSPAYWLASK
jgi:hypothetical protein